MPTAKPFLLPVTIESSMPQVPAAPTPPPPASRTTTASIEIDIAGARIRLRGAVDESSVRVVLQALRGLE
jgi:transposase